jgi:hypothetical protein
LSAHSFYAYASNTTPHASTATPNTKPVKPTMSTDAIIEDLVQGNAIEIETLRKLNDGFETLAIGMIGQCLNRSDALNELKENIVAVCRYKIADRTC